MTTAQVVPGTAHAPAQVQAIAREQHAANLANSVTGIYGLSGSGKSSLADTAAEYCADEFGKITLCYAADLGGFGSKRLALIRSGVIIVWDPRNHVDPFATMEMLSLGAFPAYLLPGGPATASERERGYAPPDAELILPHRKRWSYVCPNDGERVGAFYSPQQMAGVHPCPKCGYACAAGDPKVKVEMLTVRSAGFNTVGHRIYDSMTALNEWGLSDLQRLSAAGLLPSGSSGGSLLGAADALVSGAFKFGSSSQGQYGFVQTRTYNWISNIRAIPDQVVPATMTFLVEQSKGDDDSGGSPVMGPKIAGNARTSTVPGWLGNCLYAERDTEKRVHRLWLVNHNDPLDPRRIPYLAKHRGTPLGMPDFLEDEPNKPWSNVSLGKLYKMLDDQVLAEQSKTADKYARFRDLPAEVETIVTSAAAQAAVAVAGGIAVPVQTPGVVGNVSQPASSMPQAGPRRRVASLPGAPLSAPALQPQPAPAAAAGGAPAAVVPTAGAPVASPPVQAGLNVAPIAGPAAPLAVPSPQVNTPVASAPVAAQPTPPAPPALPAAASTAGPVAPRRATRTPRPPV